MNRSLQIYLIGKMRACLMLYENRNVIQSNVDDWVDIRSCFALDQQQRTRD